MKTLQFDIKTESLNCIKLYQDGMFTGIKAIRKNNGFFTANLNGFKFKVLFHSKFTAESGIEFKSIALMNAINKKVY